MTGHVCAHAGYSCWSPALCGCDCGQCTWPAPEHCECCGQPAAEHCECCGMCPDGPDRRNPDSYWQEPAGVAR